MKLVSKSEDISAQLQKVKENGKSLVTNFFIDAEKLNYWLNKELLYVIDTEQGVLFFRKNDYFYHLYYCAASLANLNVLINNYLPDERLVIDVIGKAPGIADSVNLFAGAGFEKYTELHRYTRINKEDAEFYQSSDRITLAADEDAETITRLFEENFDKLADQIPNLDEVEKIIKEEKVLVIKEDCNIKGFLVRTFNGQTTILNNFLVDKLYRGQKIGSKLLKHYIFESKNRKRMLLWVISDNETALNAYRKHGYVKDDLVDIILVNK